MLTAYSAVQKGVVFTWVKRKVAEFRFELSFQRYEREQREKNRLEAERRFGAVELRGEIDALGKKIEVEAEQRFSAELRTVESKIDACASNLGRMEAQLALLKRDYRTELARLYETLNPIKQKISNLYERKEDAFRRKDRAKASIDAWYAKSERSFFGNKGKELPKHSLFGQSFGDLESYKSVRDSSSKEIVSCAEEIAELKKRRKLLGEQIGKTKKCRDEMNALRTSGLTLDGLSQAISSCQQEMSQHRTDKGELVCNRAKFVEAARHRYGVVTREAQASELHAQMAKFIESFETKTAHLRRRARYRQTVAEMSVGA